MEEEKKTVTVEELHESLLDTMRHFGAGEASVKTDHGDHWLIVSVRDKDVEGEEDEP
jgi:hypothetical protein